MYVCSAVLKTIQRTNTQGRTTYHQGDGIKKQVGEEPRSNAVLLCNTVILGQRNFIKLTFTFNFDAAGKMFKRKVAQSNKH